MKELAGTVLFMSLVSILLAAQVWHSSRYLEPKCSTFPALNTEASTAELEAWAREVKRIHDQCTAQLSALEESLDD